jgi:hypothetical protein
MGMLDEAAEAFVARVIGAQPGWSVQRMPVGHRGYDLVAISDRDGVRRRVSVKSRRSGDFQVGIDFTTYPADVVVLVDTAGGSHDESRWTAYVVGAATAATLATDRRCVWLLTHPSSSGSRKAKLSSSLLEAMGTRDAWSMLDGADPARTPPAEPWRERARSEAPIAGAAPNAYIAAQQAGLWPPASCPNRRPNLSSRSGSTCCGMATGAPTSPDRTRNLQARSDDPR